MVICGKNCPPAEPHAPSYRNRQQQYEQPAMIACRGPNPPPLAQPWASRQSQQQQHQPPAERGHIIQVGEGTTVAGQSTEDFSNKSRISLCYQCCKHISLDTLINTREEACGKFSCRRSTEAGLRFKKMPSYTAEACDDFQTFLIWWMDKVDHGVDESIERRAKDRVQEMRDDIPHINSLSAADLSSIFRAESAN
ncbi:hypothetical protein E0Z10_g8163 [Xylaria hypoxylon]|uniref:Uncharacterized protein n=1 Tax=Xylaria hypoxylon TaxID=37992 RepID=A0A4Z0YNB0_9PEZI|nr:hypothetical protein E0Z10_g8163 [Xylaria hypoxylon]